MQEENVESIEQELNWDKAIQLLTGPITTDMDSSLRLIFVVMYSLVEGRYSPEDHDFIAAKINDIFSILKLRYCDNAEFLFFSGIIANMGEHYFGLSFEEANFMLEKAMNMDRDNLMYKWAYYTRVDQRSEYNTQLKASLTQNILKNSSAMAWLKSKGLLGEYIMGTLFWLDEDLKKVKK